MAACHVWGLPQKDRQRPCEACRVVRSIAFNLKANGAWLQLAESSMAAARRASAADPLLRWKGSLNPNADGSCLSSSPL